MKSLLFAFALISSSAFANGRFDIMTCTGSGIADETYKVVINFKTESAKLYISEELAANLVFNRELSSEDYIIYTEDSKPAQFKVEFPMSSDDNYAHVSKRKSGKWVPLVDVSDCYQ